MVELTKEPCSRWRNRPLGGKPRNRNSPLVYFPFIHMLFQGLSKWIFAVSPPGHGSFSNRCSCWFLTPCKLCTLRKVHSKLGVAAAGNDGKTHHKGRFVYLGLVWRNPWLAEIYGYGELRSAASIARICHQLKCRARGNFTNADLDSKTALDVQSYYYGQIGPEIVSSSREERELALLLWCRRKKWCPPSPKRTSAVLASLSRFLAVVVVGRAQQNLRIAHR